VQDNFAEIRRIQEVLVSAAADRKVTLTEGLSDDEVDALEERYGWCFPPEMLEFLQAGVPIGGGWHDWHALVAPEVVDTVKEVIRNHCTPVEEEDHYYYGNDWAPAGEKTWDKAIELATKTYPVIPIRGHRCIATGPSGTLGLPVISMHQCSDNIPYGKNFWDWLACDNGLPEGTVPPEWREVSVPCEELPFWQHWIG